MIEEFHLRYLAKQTAMDLLSKLAGFTPRDSILEVFGDAIEKSAYKRRYVVRGLIEQEYLEKPALGQTHYVVTNKAFSEWGQEPYDGELNIGTPNKPLATWLSAEMMKQAIDDLIGNKARIKDASQGDGKVVLSALDARTDAELFFDRHLAENLGELASDVTNMSRAFSECLKVPPNSLTAQNIESELDAIYKEHAKEIQRLARTNDAIVVLKQQVQETGGWPDFIQRARKRVADVNLTPAQKIAKGVSEKEFLARPHVEGTKDGYDGSSHPSDFRQR